MSIVEQKVELLKLYFPNYQKEVLADLLKSCGESVDSTKALINGDSLNRSKRPIGSLYQSSISPIVDSKVLRKKHKTGNSKVIRLYSPEQVKEFLWPYLSFHKCILPRDLADRLAKSLMERTNELPAKEFYMFNNYCKSSHGSGLYISPEGELSREKLETLSYNGNRYENLKFYHEEMQEASKLIEKFMNDTEIPKTKKLPFQVETPWNSNYCVVNYYETISSHLDYHSDRLSHIGPHNFVASISLGATREFRVRKNYGDSQVYAIVIPHNSMVVMRPGCQEEYRHGVNSLKNVIQKNSITSASRFNLTYRFFPKEFINNVPLCKCGISMILRRTFKTVDKRGKYFWSCENVYQNKDCKEFYWANFSKPNNGYKAENEEDCSMWIAEDDFEKWEWIKEQENKKN